jgi:hypothetical protein
MFHRNYGRTAHAAYITDCACGNKTSKAYARKNGGKCKSCVTGVDQSKTDNTPTREQRILDHGYQAYAREEGHYDGGN